VPTFKQARCCGTSLASYRGAASRPRSSPTAASSSRNAAKEAQKASSSHCARARRPTPEKVYDLIRIGGYVPTPIAVGELLFLFKDNGLVSCVRASDRHQLWSERVEGGFYGSPIHAEGRLYK
jgi:hypothetical protein